MDRLYRLLAFGYLPKELPPIFSSGKFASTVKKNLLQIDDSKLKLWTKSCNFLLRQRTRYRRPLTILNPISMLHISKVISAHYQDIKTHTNKSNFSLSLPTFKRKTKYFRAVASKLMGDEIREHKLKMRASYPIILKCDIKNYYKSIYTHSIPWAMHGKKHAKSKIKDSKLSGNLLDQAITYGQDGQSIGIPIGPDTSFIIGEIILASLDQQLSTENFQGLRFYDDYEFGCISESHAEEILDKVEYLLSTFELELNHDKTKIIKGPEVFDNHWKILLKDYTNFDKFRSCEKIIDAFNIISKLAKDNESDYVFKYFIRRMKKVEIKNKFWPIWQNILFSVAFSEFGTLREIYEQLDIYSKQGFRINKKLLSRVLHNKADEEFKTGVTSELSWILYGFLKYDIKPARELIDTVIDKGDNTSRIIAIKLSTKKSIPFKRQITSALDNLSDMSVDSENWFLLWELYINGWVRSNKIKNVFINNDLFNLLGQHNVSFLIDPPPNDIIDNFRNIQESPQAISRSNFEHFEPAEEFESLEEDSISLYDNEL